MKRIAGFVACICLVASGWIPVISYLRSNLARYAITSQETKVADEAPTGYGPIANQDVMPGNPSVKLPETISSAVPDDATVVAPDLAVTSNGTVKDLKTGKSMSDPAIIGSVHTQADPLAKTQGKRFIPVPVSIVRQSFEHAAASSFYPSGQNKESNGKRVDVYRGLSHSENAEFAGSTSQLRQVSTELTNFQGNSYGAYWGTYNGNEAFFEADGTLFAQQAKAVIDVSQWQGKINWQAVKNSGVQGAIIRISFGWGNNIDPTAQYNIQECKRLGIPFGLYMYSYAATANDGISEANDLLSKLRQVGIKPGDLNLPIFYDLEKWVDDGRTPPTTSGVYDGIVNAWYSHMNSAGFNNLGVYSYTSYLDGPLNSGNIHGKTRWVASYGARTGFSYSTNDRGWQYSDVGQISGINGSVDLDAFGNKTFVDANPAGNDPSTISAKLTDIAEGNYYLVSAYPDKVADIAWASLDNDARAEIWQYNGGPNQLFHIRSLGNYRYAIVATQSNKVLDAFEGRSTNGTPIIQFDETDSTNQQWQFYRTPQGTVVIKSLSDGTKNRVLDVKSADSDNGTILELWGLNGGQNQQFRIVPAGMYRPNAQGWVTVDGVRYWYDRGARAISQEIFDSDSGFWYYFDKNGQRVSGWLDLSDGRRVYYDPANYGMVHGERYIDGYWYYFDANTGNMARNQDVWIASQRKWVRYDSSGHMVYGEDFRYGGWYYFDTTTGAMTKGWKYLGYGSGKWVYYDTLTGKMLHGEACIGGSWYLFDNVTGATTYGWEKLKDGRLVFYDRVTGKMLKGWHMVDGKIYHFDETTGAVIN